MMGRRRRPPLGSAKPQMTSLVDVLTVLVFFLLKNFSADGDILTPSPGLELPQSTAQVRAEKTLVIAISEHHVLAEGAPIALVDEVLAAQSPDIPALGRWLAERRKATEEIARYNPAVTFTGKLTIQGDRKIPFRLLHKVLNTCGENGYSKFSLAVLRKDGG